MTVAEILLGLVLALLMIVLAGCNVQTCSLADGQRMLEIRPWNTDINCEDIRRREECIAQCPHAD